MTERRITMPPTLVEDALGDRRNANFLAQACDLAYLAQDEGGQRFHDELGLEGQLFSVGNTQAYLAQNDDHVVVAFRGTESPLTLDGLKDWLLSDAANLLILPEGRLGTDFAAAGVGARFHQGFLNALGDIWDPLFAGVDAELKRKDRPLWITGHSLGGALALMSGWLFHRKMVSVHQIYTFGAPMIGNDAGAAAIDKDFANKLYRYVNYPDPVPKLPTISLMANHYCHCQTEKLLGAAEAAAADAAGFWSSLLGGGVSDVWNGATINRLWKAVLGRVEAHLMTSYKSLLGN
jgi:hypothetical protein